MPSEKALELVDEIQFMIGVDEFKLTTKQAAELIDAAIAEAVKEATAPLVAALEFYALEGNWVNDTVDIGVGFQTIPGSSFAAYEGFLPAQEAIANHRARVESAKKDGV